jgi:4-hydroxy-tetrahydrodipicolinate reductase
MLRICIVGAAGRMGRAVAAEALAYAERMRVVSGVETDASPFVGRYITAAGIADAGEARIYGASRLADALQEADATISFSAPEAEAQNVPKIVALGKMMVIGTTGMSAEQMQAVKDAIAKSRSSAVISPNFSPLVNVQMALAKRATQLLAPLGYDFGVVEEHHTGKKDAPSGTAKKIAEGIAAAGGPSKATYRSEGLQPKQKGELDMAVLRLGGTAGEHEVRIVGAHGRLVIETLMYSRSDFAKGAIEAALWLERNAQAGRVFGMEDILKI